MLHTSFSQWTVIMMSNGRNQATPHPRSPAPFDGGIALSDPSFSRHDSHRYEIDAEGRQWQAGWYTRPTLDNTGGIVGGHVD